MTDNHHPITPPPELVQQLWSRCPAESDHLLNQFATLMARWGADQELEACIQYFHEYDPSWGEDSELIAGLRSTRRPKPPSLKAQALEALDEEHADMRIQNYRLIRSVLESLPS